MEGGPKSPTNGGPFPPFSGEDTSSFTALFDHQDLDGSPPKQIPRGKAYYL